MSIPSFYRYITKFFQWGLVAYICLTFAVPVHAQPSYGFPIVQTYDPKAYGEDIQNWAITQRKNGFIYVGNRHSLLEFDGVTWNKIPLPNKYVVRSLYLDDDDKLYIGGTDEFGYLGLDSVNSSVFVSMKHLLPADISNFKDIWKIHKVHDKIFFQTRNSIFVYDGQQMQVLKCPAGIIANSFSAFGEFYMKCIVQQEDDDQTMGNGLYRYNNESKQLEFTGFHHKERFYNMLEMDDGQILFVGTNNPFLVYNPQTATTSKLDSKFDQARVMLGAVRPYSSTYLRDGRISISTLQHGIFIIDLKTGKAKQLDKRAGLIGNSVYNQFVDRDGNLWLAQEQGISYVRLNEPLTQYGTNQGLEGTAISATIFNKDFYVGAVTGVYRLNADETFTQLKGKNDQTWQFFQTEQELFGVQTRYFVSIDEQVRSVIYAEPWTVIPLKGYSGLWLAGNYNAGLTILKQQGQQLSIRNKIKGFNENSRKIAQDFQGNIWVSDKVLGVWKIQLNEELDSAIDIRFFGEGKGLPTNKNNYLYPYTHQNKAMPLFGTSKGFYLFDYDADSLKAYQKLNQALDQTGNIRNAIAYDDLGNMCFLHKKDFVLMTQLEDGEYHADSVSMAYLKNKSADEINYLGNGDFCITTDAGVFFINRDFTYQNPASYVAAIRSVKAKGKVVFGGGTTPAKSNSFDYENNSLAFTFAAPYFSSPEALQFQYKLEGFDEDWSPWDKVTFKEYTNIPEGDYRFLVRAKNLYAQESELAIYPFEIHPPWFRTPFAYVSSLLVLAGLIYIGIRINTYRLKKENERLEQIILQRTSEIQEQKEEIQIQAEEISSQNEVLTLQKDELERSYQNLRMLNAIGKDITQNLSLATVTDTVYTKISELLDIAEFGLGIYDEEKQQLIFKNYVLNGEVIPEVILSTKVKNRLSVYCIQENQEIWLNNVKKSYQNFIEHLDQYEEGELLNSLICLPLISGQNKIGIMSVQSEKFNAYSEYQVSLLRNIATYTAVAIENARSYERILELDQFKESMTGMIVHDLKNPLNSIIGLSSGEISAKKIQSIHQSGRQMLNLVSNILDVYKFEQAEIALHLHTRAINRVIRQAKEQVESLLQEKNIRVVSETDATHTIRADVELAERVVVNLLTNAIKYSPVNGQITIKAHATGSEMLSIAITDHGQGIPADKIGLIFDKFGQAKAKDSGLTRSTGLGLTFCKMAVEAHGGSIQVVSTEGKGATFTFTLPQGKSLDEAKAELIEESKPTGLELSEKDIKHIKPFLEELKGLKTYEASKLNSILKKIEANPNSSLEQWKSAMKSASLHGNSEEFNRLLYMIA